MRKERGSGKSGKENGNYIDVFCWANRKRGVKIESQLRLGLSAKLLII